MKVRNRKEKKVDRARQRGRKRERGVKAASRTSWRKESAVNEAYRGRRGVEQGVSKSRDVT